MEPKAAVYQSRLNFLGAYIGGGTSMVSVSLSFTAMPTRMCCFLMGIVLQSALLGHGQLAMDTSFSGMET